MQSAHKPLIQSSFELFKRNSELHKLVLIDEDINEVWKNFKSLFEEVPAAGGLVLNEENEILMIFRRGSWDLPKGKLEKKEKIKECAVREVEEECGLNNVKLDKKLTVTHHLYNLKGKGSIKPSHWFLMHVDGKPKLKPQKEEDIEKAVWVTRKEAEKLLKKAFPSIVEVFKAYDKLEA